MKEKSIMEYWIKNEKQKYNMPIMREKEKRI